MCIYIYYNRIIVITTYSFFVVVNIDIELQIDSMSRYLVATAFLSFSYSSRSS